MNTNILRINNEYVKFYVTENSNIPAMLKNTGAFSVVHNPNPINEPTNALYVADELIATGYGLSSKATSKNLEYVGETVTAFDGVGTSSRYIRDYTYLINAYAYSTNYTWTLYDEIIQNYLSKKGDITSTSVNVNGVNVPMSALGYLLVPAQYKNLEIDCAYSYITYNLQKFTLNANDTWTFEQVEYKTPSCYTMSNQTFELPVGAKLTYYYAYLHTINNNTDGFSNIKCTPVNSTNNPTGNWSIGHNPVKTEYQINLDFSKGTSSVPIFVDDTNKTVISDIKLTSKGTTSYLNYPLLEQKKGISVPSFDNAIQQFTLNIGPVNITPKYKIYYWKNASENHPYIFYNQAKYTTITNDTILNIDSNWLSNEGKVVIAVPTNVEITNAWFTHEYGADNVKNDNIFVKEICMGDLYNMDAVAPTIAYFNSDYYLSDYHWYTLNFRHDYQQDLEIHIDTKIINNDYQLRPVDAGTMTQEPILNSMRTTYTVTNRFLQNELYNGMHWFTPLDLPQIKTYNML